MTRDADHLGFAVLNAAANGWDVLRWNWVTGRFVTGIGNNLFVSVQAGISADGRDVTFSSGGSSIVAGETDRPSMSFGAT